MEKLTESTLTKTLSAHESAVIRALIYFDVFSYPLKAKEIAECVDFKDNEGEDTVQSIQTLVEKGFCQEHNGFLGFGDLEAKVSRRVAGNNRAEKRMEAALKRSRFIAKFPFIRGVMLSGSLSKGYMAEDSDIDFFIVTQPGRLWVARTLLIFYKKLFLFNSHKDFCVNYFIDTAHLEIEDKNIFTAMETSTLIPTINPGLYKEFWAANTWVGKYFPNSSGRLNGNCAQMPTPWHKRFGEWMLKGGMGKSLDTWCLRRTLKHWQKKFGNMSKEDFELAMRSREYVSKHHPSDFQSRVLSRIQEKRHEFEQENEVKLV